MSAAVLSGSGVGAGQILLFMATVAMAILTPGPAIVACAQCAAARGTRDGLRYGLGLAVGAALWCLASLTGLGALLRAEPRLYDALRLVGGAYLLWVAYAMIRAAGRPADAAVGDAVPVGSPGFLQGILLNLSNPKPALFYAALILSIFPNLHGLAGAAAVFAAALACELTFYSLVAVLMSRPAVQRRYQAAQGAIDRGAAALIGALGLLLIFRH